MNKKQVLNILKLALIAIAVMLAFEVLFSFDSVTDAISNFIASFDDVWVYVVIWLVMVIQVCFIPLPVYIVINAAIVIDSIDVSLTTPKGWLFILITITAYMVGCVIAYFIGKKVGKNAVKWCAGNEQDYQKWVDIINRKGKWFYALTVLLPVFPDDLLCFVAGGVSMNFGFYFVANFVGRLIGLICMIFALKLINSFNRPGIPTTLIGWAVAFVLALIAFIVVHLLIKKEEKSKGKAQP